MSEHLSYEDVIGILLATNRDLRTVAENPSACGHPEFLQGIDDRIAALQADLPQVEQPAPIPAEVQQPTQSPVEGSVEGTGESQNNTGNQPDADPSAPGNGPAGEGE